MLLLTFLPLVVAAAAAFDPAVVRSICDTQCRCSFAVMDCSQSVDVTEIPADLSASAFTVFKAGPLLKSIDCLKLPRSGLQLLSLEKSLVLDKFSVCNLAKNCARLGAARPALLSQYCTTPKPVTENVPTTTSPTSSARKSTSTTATTTSATSSAHKSTSTTATTTSATDSGQKSSSVVPFCEDIEFESSGESELVLQQLPTSNTVLHNQPSAVARPDAIDSRNYWPHLVIALLSAAVVCLLVALICTCISYRRLWKSTRPPSTREQSVSPDICSTWV